MVVQSLSLSVFLARATSLYNPFCTCLPVCVPACMCVSLCNKFLGYVADLEKAASGACGHFVGYHAILRAFLVQYPLLLTEDGGGGDVHRELRSDKVDLR